MPRAQKNANNAKQLSEYFSDIDDWPNDWMGVEEDLEIGRGLLALFILFIQHLIDDGPASKTIKNHGYHLRMLGTEIIERLNQDDENKSTRPLWRGGSLQRALPSFVICSRK